LQSDCSDIEINQVIESIIRAKRPLILAGGGIRTAQATQELSEFIEKTNIPVVTSLMGLDVVAHDNPCFYGMIGSYGNRYSNLTIANCDLLLILGSRLDTRQTGARTDTFARAAKKIHIDIDPTELNAKIGVDQAVRCDIKQFLKKINIKLNSMDKPEISGWYEVIQTYKSNYNDHSNCIATNRIDPNLFIEKLSALTSEGDIICLDVGQNQMWAAQSFALKKNQRMLISGGMGAMGFSLPASIGALKASPGNNAIVLTGDGGIQINIQELETIRNHNLSTKIFVLNNNCLGMITQFQELYLEGRLQSSVIGYSCPDFAKLADAYGIPSFTLSTLNDADALIKNVLGMNGPVLVNIHLEQKTTVNPKLEFNRPSEDMLPLLDRNELKRIMLIDLVDE
jgi:acetolactate synthase-1/2/3 large subunit